ncbi:MAG: type II secretion system major pseudopilin GspG [Rubripirellula sp.]|nr:type II secretion system major pseudopilin GspG [Rubripirellula sp.]
MLCDRSGQPVRYLRNAAFSLVELIVVMVILGMLAGLVAVRTRGYLIASKQNVARAEIANMVKAIETFYSDQGRYPTTDEGLNVLSEGTSTWPDGFLNKVPLDPWKNSYEYVSPGSTEPYEVICLGADGREGGEGENQDITSELLGQEDA